MLRPTLIATAALLAACTTPSKTTLNEVREQQNPADRTQRTITNFTPALRCMDELMFKTGVRDVTLMMEELRDATQKVPVSARDMMTSAISDMTRRSRAVRLSVVGGDQQNLAQVLQAAQKSNAFAVVPEFNVRGTISQLDEDVKRDASSFGFITEKAFGVRFGSETKFSVLGFDAAVVRTETMTLMPGVTSKNTTVISRRDASAGDGQARILNAASVFSFSSARSEGTSQAARNMVELAAIELVGKLIRVPYWQCLGTPDDNPEVQREIDDWFVSMSDDERTAFLKERLRERRYFEGGLGGVGASVSDGASDATFQAALSAYRRAMGLPAQGEIDLAFFRRFVTQSVAPGPLALGRKPAVLVAASPAPVVAPVVTPVPAPPIQVFVQTHRAGPTELRVTADVAGYVYCYAQDPASKAIRRIYPNRFARDPRIEAGRALALPGEGRFALDATHGYACVHAPTEVYNSLPPPLRWGDFEDIRLPGFDEIRQQFADASGQPILLAHAQKLRR